MSISRNAANFIERITYDECSRPFWVYAETALPAFLELWITLATLDLEDLVRSRGFRKSGEDLGLGRRGRRNFGIKLPPPKGFGINRYAALGVRTLLIVTIPLEIIGFGMLLYFSVDKFFYRWNAMLEQIQCDDQKFTLMKSSGPGGMFPSPPGGAVALPILLNNTSPWSTGNFGTSVGHGVYEVTFAITFTGQSPINPQEYKATILSAGSVTGAAQEGNAVTVGAGQEGTSIINTTLYNPGFGPMQIAWVVRGPAVPVGLGYTSAHVVVVQRT